MPKIENKYRTIQPISVSSFVVFLFFINNNKWKNQFKQIIKEQLKDQKNKKNAELFIKNKTKINILSWRNVWPVLQDWDFIDEEFNIKNINIITYISNNDIDSIYKLIAINIYEFNWIPKNKELNKNELLSYESALWKYEKIIKKIKQKMIVWKNKFNSLNKITSSFDFCLYVSDKGIYYSFQSRIFNYEKIETTDGNFLSRYELLNYLNSVKNNDKYQYKNFNNIQKTIEEYITKKINININSQIRKMNWSQKKINKALALYIMGIRTAEIDGIINKKNIDEIDKGHAMYINIIKNTWNIGKEILDIVKEKFQFISYHQLIKAIENITSNNEIIKKIKNLKENHRKQSINKTLFLSINDCFVDKKNTLNNKNISASEAKKQRLKAEITGEKAENNFYHNYLKEKIKTLLNEHKSSKTEKEVLTKSEESDTMGCDFKIEINGYKEFYEVKHIESFKSISARISMKQIKLAIENQDNFYFVFVKPNGDFKIINGIELLDIMEFKPITLNGVARKNEILRNFIDIKKMIDN